MIGLETFVSLFSLSLVHWGIDHVYRNLPPLFYYQSDHFNGVEKDIFGAETDKIGAEKDKFRAETEEIILFFKLGFYIHFTLGAENGKNA